MNEPTIAPSKYYIVIGRDGYHIHEYVEAVSVLTLHGGTQLIVLLS